MEKWDFVTLQQASWLSPQEETFEPFFGNLYQLVRDTAPQYRRMDVFCMPTSSRWGGLEVEGLGLVYLEAAATALPVLAGDSGGSPETVLPGETGFVVSSVSDVVEGLNYLLDDPDRAARMGHAGRSFVEAEFTWERVIERFHDGFAPHLG